MRQSEVIKLLERFSAVVAGRYSPNAVILYGSYAKGSPRASSDIDVAVMFDDFSGNWIEASTDLWDISYTIDSRIEPFLVDKSTANPSFVDEIEATGRVIWDSKSTRLP
jgi:predicted nucleotidyltransferase